jgi:hypothetical protein
MNIARDRYLDDTSRLYIRLVLQTGTQVMHSALSDAPEETRQRVGDALTRALNEIEALLKPVMPAGSPTPRSAA